MNGKETSERMADYGGIYSGGRISNKILIMYLARKVALMPIVMYQKNMTDPGF